MLYQTRLWQLAIPVQEHVVRTHGEGGMCRLLIECFKLIDHQHGVALWNEPFDVLTSHHA